MNKNKLTLWEQYERMFFARPKRDRRTSEQVRKIWNDAKLYIAIYGEN